MKSEWVTAAALLAQTALKDWDKRYGALPEEAMTEAFVTAYRALEAAQTQLAESSSD